MPCTTLLVGKKASYDGSTLMARNEDSPSGQFTAKKFIVVRPEDQPRHYQSVLSAFSLDLKEVPLRYTAMPNADPAQGFWGEAGVKEANVAMSETETITSNPRVLGADPLVKSGIGEEDMLALVLPYIHSAREGVERLGRLLEQFGTYEMNGIGFQDANEIWWMETIGGHHWMARRVPDDACVVMPNQQGIDMLDLEDALGRQEEAMCSADLAAFIAENHLDLGFDRDLEWDADEDADDPDLQFMARSPYGRKEHDLLDARAAFGSHDDADHTYITPRAWFMLRCLSPHYADWDRDVHFGPASDRLPWAICPEKKVTVEDVKYLLSSHYQGTPYDCYGRNPAAAGERVRPIGINRNNFLALTQIRPYLPADRAALEWIAEGSNVFNAFVPFYTQVNRTPAYLAETGKVPDSQQFYWANRLIGALADAHFAACASSIERYQKAVAARAHALIHQFDRTEAHGEDVTGMLERFNDSLAAMAKEETNNCLGKVLYEASNLMKNAFSRSDA
jgi:dipeptidase